MRKIWESVKEKWPEYVIEIIVIVGSILGAFTLDKWNEGIKESKLEYKLLKGLKEDITSNISDLVINMKQDSLIWESNSNLIEVFESGHFAAEDSLEKAFGLTNMYYPFYPKQNAYEALKSQGLEIIKNDSLLSKIIQLHDQAYRINDLIQDLKKEIFLSGKKIHWRHFEADLLVRMPNDLSTLLKDQEYYNWLTHVNAEKSNYLFHSNNLLQELFQVREMIEVEMGRF